MWKKRTGVDEGFDLELMERTCRGVSSKCIGVKSIGSYICVRLQFCYLRFGLSTACHILDIIFFFLLLFPQLKNVFEYFGTYTTRKNSRIEPYEHKLECTLFPTFPIFPISWRRAIKISRLKSLKLHIKYIYYI